MLIGRENEQAELSRAVGRVSRGEGAALWLRGPAGIGKTALLTELVDGLPAVDPAPPRVLRVSGLVTETDVPYGALDRLLRPVADRIDGLPPEQAAVIRDAMASGETMAGRAVGRGVSAVLAASAPVLVVVDDAHLLDSWSTEALLFAAHRVAGSSVGVVFAAEPGWEAPGVPELAVGGLPDADARALLASYAVPPEQPLAPYTRDAFVRSAAGNPLALWEFVNNASQAQLSNEVCLPSMPPVSTRVLARFGRRLSPSPGAKLLLGVAAAERDGDLASVMAAAARLGLSESDLTEAEPLLWLNANRVAFRHPLERAAAYHLTPLSERLRVHGALAETAADELQRVYHRSLSTLEPDEPVAAGLADAAGQAETWRAACMYDHAASLTPDPEQRAQRRRAASHAMLRGDRFDLALPRLRESSRSVDGIRDALLAGDDVGALTLAERLVPELRAAGRTGLLAEALALQAMALVVGGEHAAGRARLTEAQKLVAEFGHEDLVPELPEVAARLAAIEGADDGESGLLALGRGEFEAAARQLEAVWRGPDRYRSVVVAADLAEAAFRAGQPERAAEPLAVFEDWVTAGRQPWARAVLARSKALLSRDIELLGSAVRLHERGGRPFERARTELLYGEWLRRAKRKTEGRAVLRSAVEIFERLGATDWAGRARAELRALGQADLAHTDQVSGEPVADWAAKLTPQEERVVRLAARGVSNRDIATGLYLSPRTVEYHLYNAYQKLAVSSRAELAELAAGR